MPVLTLPVLTLPVLTLPVLTLPLLPRRAAGQYRLPYVGLPFLLSVSQFNAFQLRYSEGMTPPYVGVCALFNAFQLRYSEGMTPPYVGVCALPHFKVPSSCATARA